MSTRRGFSFAEVLFAVAILGIGFIMIAAIFPAAILQTQASADETTGAAVIRASAEALAHNHAMNSGLTPGMAGLADTGGKFYSFRDPRIIEQLQNLGSTPEPTPGYLHANALWNAVKHTMISAHDPRFGCVAVYSRPAGTARAELIVVGVRMRADDSFKTVRGGTKPNTWGDVDPQSANAPPPELLPRPVRVVLTEGVNDDDDAEIFEVPTSYDAPLADQSQKSDAANAAVEGAVLIISDDRLPPPNTGKFNGRIYRLADKRNDVAGHDNVWRLVRGEDLEIGVGADGVLNPLDPNTDDTNEQIPPRKIGAARPSPGDNNAGAIAFIIGQGYASPGNPSTAGGGNQVLHVLRYLMTLP